MPGIFLLFWYETIIVEIKKKKSYERSLSLYGSGRDLGRRF